MSVLDRYIVRSILGAVLLVMMVLLVLGALFMFIDQQDDVGIGHYTALDAFWYTLLNLPQLAYELLPITALIGSLLGLGSLARGSELTVIRATGVSVARLAGIALMAGLLLMLLEVAARGVPGSAAAAGGARTEGLQQAQRRELRRRRRLGARWRHDPERRRAVEPAPVRQHADLRAVAAAPAARARSCAARGRRRRAAPGC